MEERRFDTCDSVYILVDAYKKLGVKNSETENQLDQLIELLSYQLLEDVRSEEDTEYWEEDLEDETDETEE